MTVGITLLRGPTLINTNRIPATAHRARVTHARHSALIARLSGRVMPTVALALVLEAGVLVACLRAEVGALVDGHGLHHVGCRAGKGARTLAVGEAADGDPAAGWGRSVA